MNNSPLKLLCIILVGMLGACASSPTEPDIKYFLLDEAISSAPITVGLPLVRVEEIKLPAYLDSSRLVMKNNHSQIVYANFHRWAGNLDDAIRRSLIKNLNKSTSSNPNTHFFVEKCMDCASVRLQIEHFYPTVDGELFLTGSIYLLQRDDDFRIVPFAYNEDLQKEGYAGAVEQMRRQLVVLANTVEGEF